MKKWKRYTACLLIAAAILSLTACGEAASSQGMVGQPGSSAADPAPGAQAAKGPFEEFTVQDLDANEVTQSIFADHDLTVINVWGTFCKPCVTEMPELKELSEEYAEQGVQIIGLVGDGVDQKGVPSEPAIAQAKAIIEKTGADYLHILPTGELFRNVMGQITGVPTTIFVDQDGKQVGVAYVGARSKKQWAKLIDEALAELSAQ